MFICPRFFAIAKKCGISGISLCKLFVWEGPAMVCEVQLTGEVLGTTWCVVLVSCYIMRLVGHVGKE